MTASSSRSKRSLRLCRAGATVGCRSARRSRERGLDEGVDITTEHTSWIADLDAGPMVLDERVRMEDVGTNLAPPVRRAKLAALLRLRLLLLPHLPLEQPRAKYLHRGLLVLELRTLVLARDDDSGRQMSDADCRLGLVDVLPARAGRAVRVDPQVLRADIDFGLALNLGGGVDKRERRLAPLLEVEGRDADEPMCAALGLEVAVRVRTLDGEGRAAETGLVAGGRFEELRFEAAPLGPTQVHPHQHLGPIRRVGATHARRDRENGAAFVIWTGELSLEARMRDFFSEIRSVMRDVGFHLGIAVGHRRELAQVFGTRAKPLPPFQSITQVAKALQDSLRPL